MAQEKNYAPQIFQWMGTYMQVQGMEAHLVCRAEGHHTTIWIGPDDAILQSNERFEIRKNGDLIIKDLSFNDMGLYKCLVKNDHGEDIKDTFLYPMAAVSSKHNFKK